MEKIKIEQLYREPRIKKGLWISFPVEKDRNYTMDFGSYKHHQLFQRCVQGKQHFSNFENSEILAKVQGVTKNGFLKCIGDVSPFEVTLEGQLGFLFGPDELDKLLFEMYSLSEYGIFPRNITVEDTKDQKFLMSETWYWMATRGIRKTFDGGSELVLQTGYKDYIRAQELVLYNGNPTSRTCYARPVFFVMLKAEKELSVLVDKHKHNGKEKATAYKISLE